MTQRMRSHVVIALSIVAWAGIADPADAQPRTLVVAGVQMRVWTDGLAQRQPGQPVIVLEAGSGAYLETWKPVFRRTRFNRR